MGKEDGMYRVVGSHVHAGHALLCSNEWKVIAKRAQERERRESAPVERERESVGGTYSTRVNVTHGSRSRGVLVCCVAVSGEKTRVVAAVLFVALLILRAAESCQATRTRRTPLALLPLRYPIVTTHSAIHLDHHSLTQLDNQQRLGAPPTLRLSRFLFLFATQQHNGLSRLDGYSNPLRRMDR